MPAMKACWGRLTTAQLYAQLHATVLAKALVETVYNIDLQTYGDSLHACMLKHHKSDHSCELKRTTQAALLDKPCSQTFMQ